MENQKIAIKDKVKLLDFDDFAIVHKPMDKLNNVEVFYKNEFISINAKRLKLQLKAEDLYPKDYDLNSLFISFEKRKLEILSHYSIIEDIKEKLDNYEELSDEDIDTIIKVLSSLKKHEK